jgi:hypothetical protein
VNILALFSFRYSVFAAAAATHLQRSYCSQAWIVDLLIKCDSFCLSLLI